MSYLDGYALSACNFFDVGASLFLWLPPKANIVHYWLWRANGDVGGVHAGNGLDQAGENNVWGRTASSQHLGELLNSAGVVELA